MFLFIMGLLTLVLLIAVSILISLSEISFAAAREVRLRSRAEAGDKRAQAFLVLRRNSGQVMTAIQICLNGVGILGGIASSEMFTPPVTEFLSRWGMSDWWAQNLASTFSFIFVTGAFVLFADLLPKRVAMNNPDKVAMAVGWFPRVALRVLYPFVWIFSKISDAILHALKIPAASAVEPITPEDLHAILAAGTASGVLLQQEHQMIENVLALQARSVTSAMTPRDEIIFLDIQDSPEHNHEKVRTNPYSRYPLCNGGLDRVIGSIRAEDVLASVVDPSIAPSGRPHSNPIARMRREVLSVPETLNLWDTLAQFDTHGTGFALIVNEYGLVVGLITFKDIMGVLMDGLASPFEEQAIVKRDENSWLVDGAAPIGDVIRELHVLDLPDSEQFDTIGGFIMHRLRRMARKADRVDAAGFRFEVVDVEGFRINQLLVTRMTETS
ncbi:membrane protein [Acetobacter pasteurianus]|uniref:Polyamine export protein n=3 Tax=Acetobacter pasteurianus TaxID=438 RepID=C7JCM3_ACEP3|nr:hemolysin family protein [Acetobacter pasteurianus]BAU37376.1 hemolysin/magnesium/cobalt transporter CorC/HlyC [Acetobacter pasteurianus NBRC 101655]BAH98476.1 hemolysin/magnesium/cobalt transporter CorC/HlyC [Acetobacter pasteurianus IFO 3283-01]BAI01527.1 hemolysin/magnesium/cobalt transporter CorC/HlyC [Acetobacter pasteurianus IFO 3283-03]BAI04575.1 hemolysin/magnesium/cobalt transporter CorC/HlyC [Acetobacter pasteurianus IFO 3283-07]BAI07622.1 hemolysin/magnesium/cobalt transporter Co